MHTKRSHRSFPQGEREFTENRHSTNDHEKKKGETHSEHQPKPVWTVQSQLNQGPGGDNSRSCAPDNQSSQLPFAQGMNQVHTNGNHVEICQTQVQSICTTQETNWTTHVDSQEPTITPFSLLGLRLSADREQARSHAAWLCHIQTSQVLDIMPCTPLQQGLLALTAQEAGTYVARYVFEIGRNIETRKLCGAWDRVVATNLILRTRIVSLPVSGIVQVVIDEECRGQLPLISRIFRGIKRAMVPPSV